MTNPDLDRLAAARHVALTTFASDGTPVDTCMWLGRKGDALYLLTHAGAGKVERIQHNPRVEIGPSDGRGRLQGGTSTATAEVITDPDIVRGTSAILRRRYGLQYPLLRGLMMMRGRSAGKPVVIRITDPTAVASHPQRRTG